jgi:hypothetical protein
VSEQVIAEFLMNPENSSLHKEQVARIRAQIVSFEGAEAIFEEARGVTHVGVNQLIATPELVEAVMNDMHTPGMEELSHSPRKVSVRWELLHLDGEHWTALLPIRWQLTFDAEAVKMLKEMAAIVAP